VHTKYIIDISAIIVYDAYVMLKTKRTPEQIAATKAKVEAILSRPAAATNTKSFSMDGIVGVNDTYYGDIPSQTPDELADQKSEAVWGAQEAFASNLHKRVGDVATNNVVQIHPVIESEEVHIPVQIERAS